jgi:hypothetical protein
MTFKEAIKALRTTAKLIKKEVKKNPKVTLDSEQDEIRTIAHLKGKDYHIRISDHELRDMKKVVFSAKYDPDANVYRCGGCGQIIKELGGR